MKLPFLGTTGPAPRVIPRGELGAATAAHHRGGRAWEGRGPGMIARGDYRHDHYAPAEPDNWKPGADALVSCWCERGWVHVSWADVRAGRTASCGRSRCTPEVLA